MINAYAGIIMLFILPGRTNMLAKYDGRSAIRQSKLESTMDLMTIDPVNPTNKDY